MGVPGGVVEVFGFSAGENAEVWSNGRGEWLPCLVQAVFPRLVEADGFTIPPNTIKVQFEAGSKLKYIREGGILQELRRTDGQQRGASGAHQRGPKVALNCGHPRSKSGKTVHISTPSGFSLQQVGLIAH